MYLWNYRSRNTQFFRNLLMSPPSRSCGTEAAAKLSPFDHSDSSRGAAQGVGRLFIPTVHDHSQLSHALNAKTPNSDKLWRRCRVCSSADHKTRTCRVYCSQISFTAQLLRRRSDGGEMKNAEENQDLHLRWTKTPVAITELSVYKVLQSDYT